MLPDPNQFPAQIFWLEILSEEKIKQFAQIEQ